MPRCTVTLTANAGVSISLGGLVIWVDALHDQQLPGFSTVSPAQWARICRSGALTPPDVICFTHCHPDHYSRALTEEAARRWPSARLILPEPAFDDQLFLRDREERLSAGGVDFRFFRLTHESPMYASVPHYGLTLCHEGFRVLIPGDCAVASPQLSECLGDTAVDLALLDFPWITLRKGREFTRDRIRPRHLLVYHLPFAQDDSVGYRSAAEHAAGLTGLPDVRLLWEPLQQEEVE